MEYWCRVCGKRDLSKTDFYAQQLGVTGKGECKACTRSRVKSRRDANQESVREYDRQRAKLPHRKEFLAQRSRSFVANYPRAKLAQNLVYSAMRSGHLVMRPCACGETQTVAHHDDYAKPLDVRWLCQPCHIKWHIQNGPGANKEGPAEKKPRGYWKRQIESMERSQS